MDKALVTFVGAGLSTIVIGLGRKVPAGAIANGQYLVGHLLETNPIETRHIIEGVVREIFVDWRASGVPIAIADAHLEALPAVLDQHRVAQNILVGGLAVAKKSEKEGRRAVTVPARRIAAEFVTLARETQALSRSKLSDSITFYLTERMFAQLLLERRTLIGLTTSMNTYFMKSMWMGAGASPGREGRMAESGGEAKSGQGAPAQSTAPVEAPVIGAAPAVGARTRSSGFGGDESPRAVMFKPIALPQRERPLLAANVRIPTAPEASTPVRTAEPDFGPPLTTPESDLLEPLPSLDAIEAELEPMFVETAGRGPIPRDGYHENIEVDSGATDNEAGWQIPGTELDIEPETDALVAAAEFDATPDRHEDVATAAYDVSDSMMPTASDLPPIVDDLEVTLHTGPQDQPENTADVVRPDLPRSLGPTRLRRVRKIMLAPAPLDPMDLPLPGLEHLIEETGVEPTEEPSLAPEAEDTADDAEQAISDEPMRPWPVGSAEAPAADPIDDRPEPMVPREPQPRVEPVPEDRPAPAAPLQRLDTMSIVVERPVTAALVRPAEAPSAAAMMIVRTSNGELTAATAGAIEYAIKTNTALSTVDTELLRASAKLMIEVMERLSARIADADAGADSTSAALTALREGDFAGARLKLADAEIAVRADAEAGGDLEKSALRSVVDLRLVLADIEIACHDRQAAAEHLEVAVGSVPADEKMRRWSLAVRFARMLFRTSTGASGMPPDVASLDRMIGAYRMALGSIVEINAPQDYVRAEVELATILNRKARLTGDIGLLNEVAGFIDHTIDMLARARAMDDWAEAHTQRGVTYAQLAAIEWMTDHFDTAARSFDSALGHVSAQRSPLVWAEARIWFGLLLKQWGRKTGQANRLAEGITHLRAVCDAEAIELPRTGFTLAELTLELAEAISLLAMARNEPGLHTTAISVLSRTIARTSGTRSETTEAELYDKLGESLWQLGAFREDADMLAKAGQAIDRAIESFIASGEDAKAEARITDLERLHDFRTDLIEARVTRQVRTPRIA